MMKVVSSREPDPVLSMSKAAEYLKHAMIANAIRVRKVRFSIWNHMMMMMMTMMTMAMTLRCGYALNMKQSIMSSSSANSLPLTVRCVRNNK